MTVEFRRDPYTLRCEMLPAAMTARVRRLPGADFLAHPSKMFSLGLKRIF